MPPNPDEMPDIDPSWADHGFHDSECGCIEIAVYMISASFTYDGGHSILASFTYDGGHFFDRCKYPDTWDGPDAHASRAQNVGVSPLSRRGKVPKPIERWLHERWINRNSPRFDKRTER